MHTVTVTTTGHGGFTVAFAPTAEEGTETTTPTGEATATVEAEDKGPSPIAPELKELAWGAGAFLVLFLVMRIVLFPKLKKGMQARYGKIRGDHETADSMRADARAEVESYEQALAGVRAEAAARTDAALQTLEAERTAAIAEVNVGINARRAEAVAANEASRAAAAPHIRDAVADVSARAAELATGRRPDADTVQQVLDTLMAGETR